MNLTTRFLYALSFASLLTFPVNAQVTIQSVQLQPGWNAVFLWVDPAAEDRSCESVCAAVPAIEQIWRPNVELDTVQFVEDPTEIMDIAADPVRMSRWLVHRVEPIPGAPENSLHAVHGGHAYLIKVRGEASWVWSVVGTPTLRVPVWKPDSFNLTGFHVDWDGGVPFGDYFSAASSGLVDRIYSLNSEGDWRQVTSSDPVLSGRAYWVRSFGEGRYGGPANFIFPSGQAIDFGDAAREVAMEIEGSGQASDQLHLSLVDSFVPGGGDPTYAGPIALSYWAQEGANPIASAELGWKGVGSEPVSVSFRPQRAARNLVRLGIRRSEMNALPSATAARLEYRSLLDVRTDSGMRFLVPVRSQSDRQSEVGATDKAGLWVGEVEVFLVSHPKLDGPGELERTSDPASFRVLVHVDENGQSRFLQQVYLVWEAGRSGNSDADGNQEVLVSGGEVLVVNDDDLDEIAGAGLRDGRLIGRRISTTNFGFSGAIPMEGIFGARSQAVQCSVELGYDHPLNPFKHAFHPDHDNMDSRFEQKLPEGVESFTVRRDLSFSFEDPSKIIVPATEFLPEESLEPLRGQFADFDQRVLVAQFDETVHGLHKEPIRARGRVRFVNVSGVTVLR